MDRHMSLVCPVLVGRDSSLAFADARLASAGLGEGGIVFLGGEAGVGKTRLLGSIERRAAARGFRNVRGGTYPGDIEVAGAVLLDLARAMRRQPAMEAIGAAIEARLTDAAEATRGGDAHRRRRLLTLDLAAMLASLAEAGPAVIALEDLHQADDLTFETLTTLAQQIATIPLLIVGTYRSDELYPRAPIREWRSHLLTKRLAQEVRLDRLTLEASATMVALILGLDGPPPAAFVDQVFRRTDGIPLHVEELLGMLTTSGSGEPLSVPDLDVPDTLDAAILDRMGHRSAAARQIAACGAVIGRSFELDLLAATLDTDAAALGSSLAELADHFVLSESQASGRYGFRHGLICDAIYAQIPAAERRNLNSKVADAAARQGAFSDAFLSSHFERAGRPADAYESALRAAVAATQLSSHREAFQLYERVARNLPPDLDPAARAVILEGHARSATACDANAVAADALERAHVAWHAADRPIEAATTIPALVEVRHLLGDSLELRAARLRDALDALETVPESRERDRARGRALAGLAAAYMLDRRLDESLEFGSAARQIATLADDIDTELHATVTVGVCLVFEGRTADGWALLESAIARAQAANLEGEAARAYRMLGSSASAVAEYERAEHWLREGIDYAARVEAWNHRHYMAAHLGHVLWATGRWASAEEIAEHALADGRGGITTKVAALHALGFVALGRGDADVARTRLVEALEIGDRMQELQRTAPALWGLAELDLQLGDPAAAIEKCERGRAASGEVEDAAYLVWFLVTGTRALLAVRDPGGAAEWIEATVDVLERRGLAGTIPAIAHARGLVALAGGSTGQARELLRAAIAGWESLNRAWEGGAAQVDMAECELRTNRLAESVRWAGRGRDAASALGSPPLAAQAQAVLKRARASHPTDAPWAPLTAREFEVARLVAEGGTNPSIAGELGLSPRTVGSHIEHIMAKLGAERRSEIAAWATTISSVGAEPPLRAI
ncbi:MAG: AAA family ATPase [Candidatus Limnocylindrales bacterium]